MPSFTQHLCLSPAYKVQFYEGLVFLAGTQGAIKAADTHSEVFGLHLVVDELLIPPLLLRDCDVGQGGFKVHNLLHQCSGRLLRAAEENPQLGQEAEVCLQILQGTRRQQRESVCQRGSPTGDVILN